MHGEDKMYMELQIEWKRAYLGSLEGGEGIIYEGEKKLLSAFSNSIGSEALTS